MSLLLSGCHLVDATSPAVRRDQHVLVEGGTVRRVGGGHPPAADQHLDLDGAYVLPGLWDVHTHLRTTTWTGPSLALEAPDAIYSYGWCAMEALQVGVTSMRVVGIPYWADVAWREAFNSGQFLGPRLFCCGHGLRTSAGHDPSGAAAAGLMMSVDGPEAMVQAVRHQIQHGVDQIKLVTTGGIMGGGHDVMSAVMFLRQELEAALRIARQRGVPVAVHATYHEAVKWAVRAGAHSIEHGYLLDEEAASLMAQGGVFYVPTLALSHLTADQASTPYEQHYCQEHVLPDGYRQRANRFAPGHEDSFRMALQAGVKIASGSDQGPPRQAALLEIEFLARYGLGAHGAIVAATRTAAELCRVQDRLGTIEPGKLADLIVVAGDPLEDIHNLRRLLMVIKAGEVVVDRREAFI
ncbi:MAG TPA: amidohydrolase family protein [Candidatus Tectomicrobia bacterium]|nr:amidohydrolase family protein [Candidatus Tectomicrobia bacterium]